MSKATYPLKPLRSVKAAAMRLAKEDGVSLDHWIASAVAQKVGAVETAADFFRQHAGDARPGDLHALLALAPDQMPDPGDSCRPRLDPPCQDPTRPKNPAISAAARSGSSRCGKWPTPGKGARSKSGNVSGRVSVQA